MPFDHTGDKDCPACAKVKTIYLNLGREVGGLSSRDAAFLIALVINTVHRSAPTSLGGAVFLADLALFLSYMEDSEKPPDVTCH